MIFGKNLGQSLYRIAGIIWLLLTVHVGYTYVSFSADTRAGKGGTLIEASLDQVNYLPYVTTNDADKFYQSLLFDSCVFPSFSGTNITYREELCDVTTDDWRTFQVRVLPGNTWSDGEPLTLNDVYFTYHTLLRENYWDIGSLNSYRSVQVQLLDDALEVTFPSASIDNMIFFTNFILPAHRLANESLENYVKTFYTNPIGSHCAALANSENDPTSIVFDLSDCEETLLKFYQVKQFGGEEELERYLRNKENTIDLILSKNVYDGYDRNEVILNRYTTFFFNTERETMSSDFRRRLGSWIAGHFFAGTGSTTASLIQDPYLFTNFLTGEQLLTSGYLTETLGSPTIPTPSSGDQQVPPLPDEISWTDQETKEFYLGDPISDKQELLFSFAESFDRVSVTFNNGVEYFPESFDPSAQTSYYNLNPTYRNIARGRNIYTIKGYRNGEHVSTNTLIVHYLVRPTLTEDQLAPTAISEFQPLTVIYFANEINEQIINRFQDLLAAQGLSDYFSFTSFDQSETFAGKISSSDYDIALRSISMGLRKDMSNLVNSTVSDINPSNYTNSELADAINRFFLAGAGQQADLKALIDTTYREDMPFVILGKQLSSINIRSELEFRYPFRLYVLGWRRDFINDMQLFRHLVINWDKVFSVSNLEAFLNEYEVFEF